MLNDIFATSMSGEYRTTGGDSDERGTWEYVGYGNAEIRMRARGESPSSGLSYEVMIHSAERQLDEIELRSTWRGEEGDEELYFRSTIAGHEMAMHRREGEEEMFGSLTAPDESIHDGPSPIWMIHLMLAALPPVDREIIAPVIHLDNRHAVVQGGFYRFRRDGLKVEVSQLDIEGELQDRFTIELADDGCPRMIQRSSGTTEIIRLPEQTSSTGN